MEFSLVARDRRVYLIMGIEFKNRRNADLTAMNIENQL